MIPIITAIKNEIELTLNTIPEIKKVYMFPLKTIDIETAPYPFVAVFDSRGAWENRNQMEGNEVRFTFETWLRVGADVDTLVTKLDLYEAKIHDAIFAMCNTPTMKKLIQKSQKSPPTMQYIDEDSTGVLIQEYTFTYLQNYGNSFI
jgi:hypothetical protein